MFSIGSIMKVTGYWWKAMTDRRDHRIGHSCFFTNFTPFRSHQSGASTAEYLVAMIVVVAMLFLPIPGENASVMEMMVQGFKDSHHHYVWGMSYPL